MCYNPWMIFDLAIVGGGPAATAAAVYAGRKQLKTVVIAEEIGGQSAVSETIYNWIGTPSIGGGELAKAFQTHMEGYTAEKAGTVTLSMGKRVQAVSKGTDGIFTLTLSDQSTVQAISVLVSTGSRHKKLDVPGAAQFDNKGIMYCATCDGPLFSGMDVAVIGAGNAAFEAALQLSQYANHVTLLARKDVFKADPITIAKVQQDPKVTIVTNVEVVSIDGSTFVERLSYKTVGTAGTQDDVKELALSGVFVEIGQLPNTELVADIAKLNEHGKIVADPYNQRTSVTGLWAAGDCTDGWYHQNNIAAGDGVKAIEDIYFWLKTGK
jgi:NADH-dependent peroxiredoxin subunit F